MTGTAKRSAGPVHLALDRSDTAALAEGSSRLCVVARAVRRDVADQVEIDRAMFARAAPPIVAAFAGVERAARHAARHAARTPLGCRHRRERRAS